MPIGHEHRVPKRQLLTLNCHEAWVHQLEALGCPLEIIDGLPNRPVPSWDIRTRPVPENGRLITLAQAHEKPGGYDCIIAHSIQDLMDVRRIAGARLLVIHNRLESRLQSESKNHLDPPQVQQTLKHYLKLVGGHVVAVSAAKGQSWGFAGGDVVEFGVEITLDPPWNGELAAGLRVANQIDRKKEILLWDFHTAAFAGIPVTLIGHNPGMPGVYPSKDWDDLKQTFCRHRFFIHTAHPLLEDGYNMATIEAMAAGLPVLGNRHPSSPVEHGVSGFLSDDPATLNQYAHQLLADRELAGRMGQQARQKVARCFSRSRFASRFMKVIEKAMAYGHQRS
ncbi:MAG: glycosyltransferase [Magnetococcales bacterium]|nr:glycosyltransferase [Magnetococcales bacterium]MBF0150101.1 glycosyltransferase [Magnetococcales bacterium]MBF0172834.1 glycosyltransferase [Magnetococcales bacterium]MBF0631233.1 glycosyltransferase [Magnetococcales bacterium]